jgi:hypothetical protein
MPAPHAFYSKMLAERTASRNVFVLFCLFCLYVEAAYIIQSLVSKTLLGWLVYGGNFAPN